MTDLLALIEGRASLTALSSSKLRSDTCVLSPVLQSSNVAVIEEGLSSNLKAEIEILGF